MRKIFLLLTIFLKTYTCSFAQSVCAFNDIDYTNYYEVFSDNFNYNPATFQSDPAFQSKWIIPFVGDPSIGNANCWIEPSQITMPSAGIIRFTETLAPGPYTIVYNGVIKSHISGWLHTQPAYFVDFGIIEAAIKVPPEQIPDLYSAFPTFWVPNYHADPTQPIPDDSTRKNEVDIMDNDLGHTKKTWTKFYTYTTSNILQAADETLPSTPCFRYVINLDDDFHIFSCLWTPSRITFYLDKHYLKHYDIDGHGTNNQFARTFGQIHSLIIALQTKVNTIPNLSMDVDWVRYLALKCDETDYIVDAAHPTTLTTPPYLPPDFPTNYPSNFNMLKHKRIRIETLSSPPIQTRKEYATVLQAESTTLLPNFLADESTTTWGTSTTNVMDSANQEWIKVPIVTNGYLEIRAHSCDTHSDAGDIVGEGEIDTNSPDSKPAYIEDKKNISRSVLVYPNPTDGSFTIQMPQSGNYNIRVMNIIGSTVYEGKMKDEQKKSIQLDQNLPLGNYTIHISGEGLRHVEKLTLTN